MTAGLVMVLGRFEAVTRLSFASLLVVAAILAVLALLHRVLIRRDLYVYWPWSLVGFLSAGAPYSIGPNSGFAGFVAVLIFSTGAFHVVARRPWYDARIGSLLGVCVGHLAVVVLVLARVLPDAGNAPTFQPGAPFFESALLLLLVP